MILPGLVGALARGVATEPAGPLPGYRMWFDLSQETGYDDGDVLPTILDRSGNGYDLVLSIFELATYQENVAKGMPGASFVGAVSYASFLGASPVPAFVGDLTQTVFVVVKGPTMSYTPDYKCIFDCAPDSSTDQRLLCYIQDDLVKAGYASGLQTSIAFQPGVMVIGVLFAGAGSRIRVNDDVVEMDWSSASNIAGNQPLLIGRDSTASAGYLDGHVLEYISYTGALSVPDFDAVFAYLQDKYITTPPGEWTARSAATARLWKQVVHGGGLFVAVATSSPAGEVVMTSPDGVTWTARTAATTFLEAVGHLEGVGFVALTLSLGAGDHAMSSPDGITWTARTISGDAWTSVIGADGRFVAVGQGGLVATSTDGITWTDRVAAEDNDWYGVAHSQELGLYVAVGNLASGSQCVMHSPDGATWTAATGAEDNNWRSIAWGNGRFVAVASNGDHRVMWSEDGATWTAASVPDGVWWRIAFGDGIFVAVSSSGDDQAMWSTDGELWTVMPSLAEATWRGICHGAGRFVAVAADLGSTDSVATVEVP